MSGQFNRIFGTDDASKRDTRTREEEAEVFISGAQDAAPASEPVAPPEQPATPVTAAPQVAPAAAGDFVTHIGAGSIVEGKITCKGPARFGGAVNGDIVADDVVVVDDGATVEANLTAGEAVIGGKINGNVSVDKRVSLSATARIEGDIQTPSLTIEEGAIVKGKVDVAPKSLAKPAPAISASPRPDFSGPTSSDAPFPS